MSEVAKMIEEAQPNVDLRHQYYARYASDIREIFEHCGCDIDDSTEDAFCVLASTTEAVDHFIDNAKTAAIRDKYRDGVLKILSDKQPVDIPAHIEGVVDRFRRTMEQRGCLPNVRRVIEDMFSLQEEMRNTTNVDRYIDLSLEEGEGLGNLVLSVAHERTNPTIKRVAGLMTPVANLSDHLFDAQRDYENGEISFEPNRHLYLRGLKIGVPKLIRLIATYPNKRKGLQFFVERVKNAWRTRKYAMSAVDRSS